MIWRACALTSEPLFLNDDGSETSYGLTIRCLCLYNFWMNLVTGKAVFAVQLNAGETRSRRNST